MSGKKGEHEPEKEGVLATIWDYAKTFLIIFLVVFALNKLVYINAVIPSESMQTTIMKGDRIIGSRLAYKSKDPQRFDIVIFKYPDDPSKIFIKRVIGLPGAVSYTHLDVYKRQIYICISVHMAQYDRIVEQEKILIQQEHELSMNQMQMMIAQIQPHFLYNSLTALAQLCSKDPKEAKKMCIRDSLWCHYLLPSN